MLSLAGPTTLAGNAAGQATPGAAGAGGGACLNASAVLTCSGSTSLTVSNNTAGYGGEGEGLWKEVQAGCHVGALACVPATPKPLCLGHARHRAHTPSPTPPHPTPL
jgi:hypothetical protein